MSDQVQTDTAPSPEGVASRPCSKCKENVRRGNSSWCNVCLRAQGADYDGRRRKKVETERRACAMEGCAATFTWRSSHPKQICCCKSHYQQYRWRRDHPRLEIEQLPEGQKRCSKCKELLGVSDFSPSQWKRNGRCKACWRTYGQGWDKANTARRSAASRRSRSTRLLRRYGAPSDSYEVILEVQGGGCACCGGPSGQKEFHIDHDHSKPEEQSYRGLLCHGCNTALGGFEDNIDRLRQAIEYLQRF